MDPAAAPNGGYDLGELRAIQDWNVRFELSAIPGVADVGSLGGFVRQYQVEVNPHRLRQSGLTLRDLIDAFERGNLSVGGKTIDEGGREFVVRGTGRLRSANDLEDLVVRSDTARTIRVRDVAHVQVGGDFRRGALDVDGHEAVGGVVVMRSGGDCRSLLERIRERVAQVNATLPRGISLQPVYDRGQLIDRAVATLRKTLVEEVLLVALAHVIFLWHFRSIVAVTLPLPLSIIGSFILMRWFGVVSNIMSLAGLAIAIGVLVDAGIVMTENVLRAFERTESATGRPLNAAEACTTTLAAAHQVARPLFFSMLIILLGFLPVFALTGEEGKLFRPLALTKTFAMILATLLAMTLVPCACSLLVRGPFQPESRNWVMRRLLAGYAPALDWALSRPRLVLTVAGLCLTLSVGLVVGMPNSWGTALRAMGWGRTAQALSGVGSEFMPTLNEGSFLFMPVLSPRISLTEIKRLVAWQDLALKEINDLATLQKKGIEAENILRGIRGSAGAVVMVIYLDDAVRRRQLTRGTEFNASDLQEAVREGARMRLRPKVMTVATTIAGLLPILWSHQVGSEIIRPLAVPVLGGMLSSAVHILIVTPVLFARLRKGRSVRPLRVITSRTWRQV